MAMVDLDLVMVLVSSQNLIQHKTVTKKKVTVICFQQPVPLEEQLAVIVRH
jgi:hypothetical protein